MKTIFKIIGSTFSLIKELLVGFYVLRKFILSECWKFILLIGSILLTLLSFKKAQKGD